MRYFILLVLIAILPVIVNAQEKLTKLRAPSSPASSILGLQPSVVLAPKSYQLLETALFSNFLNGNGSFSVPNDFGLEFTPYWSKNHGLSLLEYLYPKSVLDQIARNSSFSLASTQNYLLGDSTSSNSLSFGYRTTLYFDNKKGREKAAMNIAKIRSNMSITANITSEATYILENNNVANQSEFMEAMKIFILKTINKTLKYNDNYAEELANSIVNEAALIPSLDLNNYDPFVDSLISIMNIKLSSEQIFNEFKDEINERYGLSVDIAYAGLINFPNNKFELSYLPRQSIWITPTYHFEDKLRFLKIIGVFRYEWFKTDYFQKYFKDTNIFEDNLDYGLSAAAQFEKYSLHLEVVGRSSKSEKPAGADPEGNELFRKEQKSDFQFIGTFNYNLTDQVILSYSVGNRFDPILNPNNTIVSMLTLNFGFGTPTKNDINFRE